MPSDINPVASISAKFAWIFKARSHLILEKWLMQLRIAKNSTFNHETRHRQPGVTFNRLNRTAFCASIKMAMHRANAQAESWRKSTVRRPKIGGSASRAYVRNHLLEVTDLYLALTIVRFRLAVICGVTSAWLFRTKTGPTLARQQQACSHH